jgi:group I intron endonuclease
VDLRVRLRYYFNINALKRNNNMLICRALLKYGYENFRLEILKYCSPEKCIKWEQFYIDLFNPEYNILKIAGSSLGSNQSEESRVKISASMKGIPKSDEAKAKMSAAKLGSKKSEETRAKMSASKKGNTYAKNHPNSIKIEVMDLETNISTVYNSIREAARALNCTHGSLRLNINSKRQFPYKGRYALKRV